MPRSRRIGLYLAIACTGSWAMVVVMWAVGIEWGSPASRAIGILYMFPPVIAALVVQGPVLKEPILKPFGLRLSMNRWFLWASFLPLIIAALTVAVGALVPGTEIATTTDAYIALNRSHVPPEHLAEFEQMMREQSIHPAIRLALQALIAGLTINLFISLAEEIGWRGFLFKEVEGPFFRRSLVIGLAWGLWLVPLVVSGYLYPDHRASGAVLVLVWALLCTPLLLYVRIRTDSVVAPAIFRGTFMALLPVPASVTAGGSDLTTGLTGGAGLVATAIVLGLLVLYDKTRAPERVMTALAGRGSREP